MVIAPTVRWDSRMASAERRASAEARMNKPRLTLRQHRRLLQQHRKMKLLVDGFRADLEKARATLANRRLDFDRRIHQVERILERCSDWFTRIEDEHLELDQLVKDQFPAPEELLSEYRVVKDDLSLVKYAREERRERKRRKSDRHAENKRKRAIQNRIAATGSALPKKGGKKGRQENTPLSSTTP